MTGASGPAGEPVRRGRNLPPTGFAGDAGEPDPDLAAALAVLADPADPADGAAGGDGSPEVLHALARARLLVPVVAVAGGETGDTPRTRRETSTDMAVVTLEGHDGRRALPVFTSLATLAAWDASARPVPVEAPRVALAAAAEGAAVLVVDVAGPVTYVVGPPALRRLAEGDPLVPLYDDDRVLAAVSTLLAGERSVTGAWLVPSAGVDARLALRVADPHDASSVASLAARVGRGLREDATVRAAVVRGLEVALVDGPPEGARWLEQGGNVRTASHGAPARRPRPDP